MARADIELNDTLKARGDAGSNSADDLLAQLAGDEVDRMLSEADLAAPKPLNVDRAVSYLANGGNAGAVVKLRQANANPQSFSAAAADPVVANSVDANSVLNATEAALDGLFDEADDEGGRTIYETVVQKEKSAGDGPAQPQAGELAVIDKQSVEEVITQRAADLIAQARIEADGDLAAPASDLSTDGGDGSSSAAEALAAEMEADEKAHLEALRRMKEGKPPEPEPAKIEQSVLEKPLEIPEAPAEIDEDKVDYSKPDKADRIPLLVRALEWMNAPLDGLSDQLRMLVGKVAIITVFNAVAIFLYVMIFRKH